MQIQIEKRLNCHICGSNTELLVTSNHDGLEFITCNTCYTTQKATCLAELMDASLNVNESASFACEDITLTYAGQDYEPYEVWVGYRTLIFYCDDATLDYDIDTIGINNSMLLVNIDHEE